MIRVPKRYNYIEAYLTLQCNFGCKWCINAHSNLIRKRKELTAREWIIALNNLKTGGLPVTLGGGEPTQHPGFYDILGGVRQKFDLLTNGSFDVGKFLKRTKPEMFFKGSKTYYKNIRISFHPGQSDPDNIISMARRLMKAGYNPGVFGINYPENLHSNNKFTELASRAGVFFFIRDYLGWYKDRLYGDYFYPNGLNGHKKNCKCRTSELLIAPNGNVFRCHTDLYEGVSDVGNVLNMGYQIEDIFRPCARYGTCNECDVKRKLAPDLISSRCSVEIKETP